MGIIKQLDQDLINKIAAGEVIERPASVVKELVENAIDAGATNILIEVKNGGIDFIKVHDNGKGMEKEDAEISIKKHTTSKLNSKEQLFFISSLGFRGEALSSITTISHTSLTTRTKNNLEGIRFKIEGGKILRVEEVGSPIGTTFEITNLFYNTPVRKKHLKDSSTEFRHITDVIQRYALMYPEISFKLIHNKNTTINAPSTTDELGNIVNIFGTDFARELIPIKKGNVFIQILGHVGKPTTLNRSDKSSIYTFVNGRAVRNKILADAIADAYSNLLNTGRYPVAILNFEIAFDNVDVNVHPTKSTVRLQKEKDISENITKLIRDELESQDLVPKVKLKLESQSTFAKEDPLPQTDIRKLLSNPEHSQKIFDQFRNRPIDTMPSSQTILSQEEKSVSDSIQNLEPSPIEKQTEPIKKPETYTTSSKLPAFNILGTIHKTYIVIETVQGLRLIDLHAAHERVLFEKFLEQYENNSISKQTLLNPEKFEASPEEKIILEQETDTFQQFGFDIEPFGGNTFMIRTMPSIQGHQLNKEYFNNLVDVIRQGRLKDSTINSFIEHWIATKSCRSAEKAGDSLELPEQRSLILDLLNCKQPHTCPHGRPTMIDFSLKDLEKSFNRIRGFESIK